VLWHPEFFDAARHPGYAALYERILRWLLEAGGHARTGKEVTRAWNRANEPPAGPQADPHP
jgi:hypothetical protein